MRLVIQFELQNMRTTMILSFLRHAAAAAGRTMPFHNQFTANMSTWYWSQPASYTTAFISINSIFTSPVPNLHTNDDDRVRTADHNAHGASASRHLMECRESEELTWNLWWWWEAATAAPAPPTDRHAETAVKPAKWINLIENNTFSVFFHHPPPPIVVQLSFVQCLSKPPRCSHLLSG